jgi:hypothetical protein
VSEERWIAPGGWRRALIGIALAVALGAAAALVLPRDRTPRLPPREP